MSGLRAWTALVLTAFRRQFWSTATLMLVFPVLACFLFMVLRRYDRIADADEAFQLFGNFLLIVYTSFIVPLCALAFGTAGLGGDREDRTLLFLLIRPLGRGMILSAKFAATLPLVLGFACGGLWVCCRLAGPIGQHAYQAYLPAVVAMSLAYTALFHLFAVYFKHATIAALVYAVFIEGLLGSIPGIVKRVAINYYGRSMFYESGVEFGLPVPDPKWFEPIGATAGLMALAGITVGSLLLAWLVFYASDYEEAV